MVLSEIYSNVKGLLFEKPSSTTYDAYVVPNVNEIIYELFEENNMARMIVGKVPLNSIPFVSNMNDDVPFEDEYIQILQYGLCSLFMAEDDPQKFSIFSNKYNNTRVQSNKMISLDTIEELSK